ncbi:MAG TPA: hypothetical protein P5509_06925, partial [Bacteroidales bacterium]|nr:hypothetical protein [Bacteroidales bacterium]
MNIFEKMLENKTVEIQNINATAIHQFYIKVLGLKMRYDKNSTTRIVYTDPKLKFPTEYIFDANGIYYRATCKDEIRNNEGEYKYFIYPLNKSGADIKYTRPVAKQMYYVIKLILKYRI